MAPCKNRPCSRCGRMHGAHSDVCLYCKREEEAAVRPVVPCALCGEPFPRTRNGARSPYCSSECASTVTEARAKVMSAVAKAVRLGEIPPAKTLMCVDCGKPASDYDHRRYLEPLFVVPTCRSCNLKRGTALDVADLVRTHFSVRTGIAEFMAKRKAAADRRYRCMFGDLLKNVARAA